MRALRHAFLGLLIVLATTSCSNFGSQLSSMGDNMGKFMGGFFDSAKPREEATASAAHHGPRKTVRTTAYSHHEADSQPYGMKNAVGTNLKYGQVRSAAADWSVYPVGTVFRINGEPYVYEIDDYGSALVGTQTIDLYKPTMTAMRNWGVRNVDIEILRWGSYEKSLAILEPRTERASHVRQMADSIRPKI